MANNRARYEEAVKRGKAFAAEKHWKEALGMYRIAVSEFPNEPAPYAGLGEACMGLKQLDKALECYKLAARYSRGDISYLKKVADIQERMGQLSEAGRTYLAVGELEFRHNQLEEALGNWERAIRLESGLLDAHRRLAMVYQRQNKTREAVRAYLSIARILQMQGEREKAVTMCRAALRLDPDNQDVLKAFELIRNEARYLKEEEEEKKQAEPPKQPEKEADELTVAVRQIARAFESERKPVAPSKPSDVNPIEVARRRAQEQLAEEIFRDEDDEDMAAEEMGLSKLERDALIGQAMDFEQRGQADEAIRCYEKAIAGGLKMPAAFFALGMLYVNKKRSDKARHYLEVAGREGGYQVACRAAIAGLS